jgi:hypothetical protein
MTPLMAEVPVRCIPSTMMAVRVVGFGFLVGTGALLSNAVGRISGVP